MRRFILDSNDKLMEPLGLGEHRSEVVGNKNTCEKCDCSDGEPIILRKLDVDCFSTKVSINSLFNAKKNIFVCLMFLVIYNKNVHVSCVGYTYLYL